MYDVVSVVAPLGTDVSEEQRKNTVDGGIEGLSQCHWVEAKHEI